LRSDHHRWRGARDLDITGEEIIDFIHRFKVYFSIIDISNIEADGTLRDFDYREVRVSEVIIEHSRTVFLVVDYSKFWQPALVHLGDLSKSNALFTDRPIPPEICTIFDEAKIDLLNQAQAVSNKGKNTTKKQCCVVMRYGNYLFPIKLTLIKKFFYRS